MDDARVDGARGIVHATATTTVHRRQTREIQGKRYLYIDSGLTEVGRDVCAVLPQYGTLE